MPPRTRFPGVSWGFDFSTAPCPLAHPDEEVTCVGALLRGEPEMKGGIPTERGMMFQCFILGRIFKPHDLISAARIGRTYSVVWGLISIVLTALIARRLRGDVAGIFAGFLLATAGINLITSFWARGQINNVALCLASMLVALHIRNAPKERAVILQFVASVLAGGAISTRWSVALIPMLLACAVARGPVFPKLVATAAGGTLGFFGLTGFYWSPDMIAANLEMQKFNLVTLYRRIGSLVTAGAAVVCTLAGTGLVTFGLRDSFSGSTGHGVSGTCRSRSSTGATSGIEARFTRRDHHPSDADHPFDVVAQQVLRRALHRPVCAPARHRGRYQDGRAVAETAVVAGPGGRVRRLSGRLRRGHAGALRERFPKA